MADPIDHIARANLPWREADRTECGRPLNDVASVVSREDIVRKIKAQGKQRAAFSTCMTCASTSDRYVSWETDPIDVMRREMERHNHWRWETEPTPEQVRCLQELRAIAALIEAHRDEFDGFVQGLTDTADLAQRRAQKRQGRR